MPDFVRRSFHELVRDALTRLIGGVAGEELVFSDEDNLAGFVLERHPVRELVRIAARVGGELRDIPVNQAELIADRTRVTLTGVHGLDDGTPLYVDYVPAGAYSPLTDTNVGSVSRTLIEALGREVALFYAKLERVYRDAFLDTATGDALDQLVALLGIQRIRAGRPTATVTFSRVTPAPGDILIPAGTLVSTGFRDGVEVRFATTTLQTLRKGTREVDVVVRALPESEAQAAAIGPGDLRVLPRPIVGVERVHNPAAAYRTTSDESDEAVRLRTKLALQGAGKVTIEALRSAILDRGAISVVLRDMPRGVPGEVEAYIDLPSYSDEDDEEGHRDAILGAIDTTRGAGVRVFTNFARKIHVAIGRLDVVLREGLSPSNEEKDELRAAVRRSLTGYVAKLAIGEAVTRSGLVAAALADDRLREVVIASVETYQEDRLTRVPGASEPPRRVYDTEVRLRDAAGAPALVLGSDSFAVIDIARDEKAVLLLPGTMDITTQVQRVVHAVVVDVELRVVPVDPLADRDAVRERVRVQRIEPTVRTYFSQLGDGQDVALADILALLDSRHYSLENAFVDARYVRDQRVLYGVSSVPVADDERAELGELRVR